jgi:hypothetical protein
MTGMMFSPFAIARRLPMPRSRVLLLLCVLLSGCSASTRSIVRLDTGQGEPLVHTPRRDVEPVALSEKEFRKAVAQQARSVPVVERPLEHARRLFGVPERSGWYLYEGRGQRLMASEPESTRNLRLLPEEEELKRCYLEWCARTWGPGDCLRLLVDKPLRWTPSFGPISGPRYLDPSRR